MRRFDFCIMAFNQDKFLRLRNEFPRFVYEGFEYGLSEGDFVATFRFSCGEYMFMPKHTFKHKDFYSFNHLSNEQIEYRSSKSNCCFSISA